MSAWDLDGITEKLCVGQRDACRLTCTHSRGASPTSHVAEDLCRERYTSFSHCLGSPPNTIRSAGRLYSVLGTVSRKSFSISQAVENSLLAGFAKPVSGAIEIGIMGMPVLQFWKHEH